jgi:O-antigen ligase
VKLAVLRGFDFDTVDGARVFHNEFLHAGYEWGLIGLVLVIAIYGQLAVASFRSGVSRGEGPGLAAVSIFPALTFSLLFENVLADAGGAGGTAFTLVFALAAISASYKRSVAERD